MSAIGLRGISKSYGAEKVLEGLDLEIEEGSFSVLLGPSGCGKSTILRIIAGLEDFSSGELSIGGKGMADVEPGDRDIAMVFQNYALYPTMSVYENIEFGLKNRGLDKGERGRRIEEIAALLGLGDYLRKKPQYLSGGQRQRVALARAMVKRPRIFLMDEPLSNLDAKLRGQIRTELIELHRRLGSTFVYVTHDQVEAMSMGTRIILLEKGRIRQAACPEELYASPANVFSARFIGTPPMNIVDSPAGMPGMPAGARFVGFRPERARIAHHAGDVPAGAISLPGELAAREMLGAEVLYKIECGGQSVSVKLYDGERIPYGKVLAYAAREHVMFFGDDGERILPA
jgi:sn-glycerol 3-phosphate transport system ATP-binding protein